MKNILITGVGGQGSVLAAKILAQAAQAKGWSVRVMSELIEPHFAPKSASRRLPFRSGESLRT